ncbi:MAG: CDP-diacylglycerol--glycerol-3-phosphate 3-phosphatidyltransferase [Sutterella wadsworthensis]|nr:CDP-diacylglycerol--glycerol-3-phosphate 3-phosphatidyltransferase [Sutterella wadsworthensis]
MAKLKPPFKLNVPMLLTWMRIAMIPLVIGIFYLPETWLSMTCKNMLATVIFIIAAVTDALDGYLARRYQGWATPMGAFLDPVADKLLVSAALVALVGLDRCDMLAAMIIIGREITVSALREWMAKVGASGAVKVNWFGKIKTIAQMVAIPMLLWWDPVMVDTSIFTGEVSVAMLGHVLIIVAAVLTIYSMYVYMMAARRALSSPDVHEPQA